MNVRKFVVTLAVMALAVMALVAFSGSAMAATTVASHAQFIGGGFGGSFGGGFVASVRVFISPCYCFIHPIWDFCSSWCGGGLFW